MVHSGTIATVDANPSPRRLSWLAGGLVIGAYLLSAGTFIDQINDDAFITFRYSRFLADGYGPLYNLGQRVEGYTNFLLMLFVAPVIALGGPAAALPFAKFVGVASGVATLIATQRLAVAWLRRLALAPPLAELTGWGAAALVAADYCFAQNSTTGLETTLFAALLAWGVCLEQAGRDAGKWRGAGVLFALAGLARPEGALASSALFLGRMLIGEWRDARGRARMAADAVLVGAAVLAHVVFRYAYYEGELLPNTYWAKLGGFDRVPPTAYILGFLTYSTTWVIPILAVLPILVIRPLRGPCLPALLLAVGSLAGILKTGADWMSGYRLLVPYWPAWSALAVCGLAGLLSLTARRVPPIVSPIAAAILVLGVFIYQWPNRETQRQHVAIHAAGYRSGHTALADWLTQDASPGDTVVLMDIGIVGYRNPQLHILDITGLTDRHIARLPGGFLNKQLDLPYVLGGRPRYVVLVFLAPKTATGFNYARTTAFSPTEMQLFAAPEFQRDYVHSRTPPTGATGEEVAAALFGAERVFVHHDPGRSYYFLAAFRRLESISASSNVH